MFHAIKNIDTYQIKTNKNRIIITRQCFMQYKALTRLK